MKLAPLALAFALTGSLFAQTPFTDPANLRGERVKPSDGRELPIDQGALGLQQLLRKLNTRASILNIVAHPDDEDGGMLTFYARGLGARVADLSLTRGEGGQNAITGDFEDALGLLRTQELLANDRYTGVDQMFGTEVDFGFSKTKEEAFAKWTHDRVLYDAVRAIRLYRPLVITATFIGGVTDGHGQHQVSGQIAQEAFKAAGDPKVFPDMIAEGILPWQPLKVYARVPTYAISDKGLFDYATNQFTPARFTNYVTGEVTTTPPSADIIVHEGSPDPLLMPSAANSADLPPAMASQTTPLSYVQFARIGLGLQKSQIGPGFRNAPTGAFDVAFHLYGSCLPNSPTRHLCHLVADQVLPKTGDKQVPQGFSLGSHGHANNVGFSPRGMPSSPDPNFFEGIDTSVEGIATLGPSASGNISIVIKTNLAAIQHSIEAAQADFKPDHPELAAPRLSEALTLTDMAIRNVTGFSSNQLPNEQKENLLHELRLKHVQLNDALALSLGIQFDASLESENVVVHTPLSVATTLTSGWSGKLYNQNQMVTTSDQHTRPGFIYADNNPGFTAALPADNTLSIQSETLAEITRPYFSRPTIEQPIYTLADAALRNAPTTPAALTIWARIVYVATPIELGRIVHDGPEPVSIIPPVSIASRPIAAVFTRSQTTAQLTASLITAASTSANINVQSPRNWSIEAKAVPAADPTHSIDFILHPTAPVTDPAVFNLTATTPDHHAYTEGFRPVGYSGLPYTNYFTPATTRIVPVDLQLPTHHHIAYLPGTGDAVPEALASINLAPTILTIADLTPTNLAQYDTVILGVRTYSAHPDLHGAPTQALLDYVRAGGNVLVQYQTPEFTAEDAPYPLSLGSNEKVVDETAPVRLRTTMAPAKIGPPQSLGSPQVRYPEASDSSLIAQKKGGALAPGYALLTTPNQITPADFNNWIEERGHGFLSTWDTHYTALTETHDPGQADQRGGLITVQLGKGHWTYCAFALYRQLPEAVPGAYRLFLNLLNP